MIIICANPDCRKEKEIPDSRWRRDLARGQKDHYCSSSCSAEVRRKYEHSKNKYIPSAWKEVGITSSTKVLGRP